MVVDGIWCVYGEYTTGDIYDGYYDTIWYWMMIPWYSRVDSANDGHMMAKSSEVRLLGRGSALLASAPPKKSDEQPDSGKKPKQQESTAKENGSQGKTSSELKKSHGFRETAAAFKGCQRKTLPSCNRSRVVPQSPWRPPTVRTGLTMQSEMHTGGHLASKATDAPLSLLVTWLNLRCARGWSFSVSISVLNHNHGSPSIH